MRSRNAEPERVPLDVRDGYVRIRRNWKRGDTIHLTLPMPARRIVAHAGVKDDAGKAAMQRGPLVYAVEAIDNGGTRSIWSIPRTAALRARFRADLLNGVEVISGEGNRPFTRRSRTTRGTIAAREKWPCGLRRDDKKSRGARKECEDIHILRSLRSPRFLPTAAIGRVGSMASHASAPAA